MTDNAPARAHRRYRFGEALKTAACVPLGLLLALAVAEGGLRLLLPWLPRDYRVMAIRRQALQGSAWYHGELGFVLAPRYDRTLQVGDVRVAVRHQPLPGNAPAGFRGEPEQAAWASADVVVLGDSMTYGVEVDQDAVWPSVLARLGGWRVVNLATTAYGTTQEALLLRKFGHRFRTRLLLVMPFINDPMDNVQFAEWQREGRNRRGFQKWCMTFGVPPASLACRGLNEFYRRLVLGEILIHRAGILVKQRYQDDPLRVREGLRLVCRDLEDIRGQAAGAGARMAVVFPSQWNGMLGYEVVAGCAQAMKVPVLKMAGGRAGRKVGSLDGHWTEAGHAEIAREVHRFLIEERLLPAGSPSAPTAP